MTDIQKENKSGGKVPNNPKQISNLRFPEFEGEWEVKKLGEVMDFKVTNSFSRENLNYEYGTVKNIHYGDIHTKFQTLFDINCESVPFINEEIDISRISDENYCKNGDIIFADASEDLNDVGKSIEIINTNGEKLLSGLHTLLARPKEDIFHLGFSGYLFKSNSVRTQIQKESQGSKVLSINVGRISKVELSFPSVEEQSKISSFLALLDERIQTQSKILIHLKSLIESLNDSLSEQKIRINSNFENWKKVRLGDLGYTFTGLSGKTKEDFGNGKRYIQYKQIFDSSKIAIENCGYVNVSENENQNSVKYGDIFFTISSETPDEIGMSSVLLEDVKNVYLNSFCFGFRLNSFNEMLPEFARFLFRSKVVRNEIKKLAQGSTRYNMSKTELLKLEILLPSIMEQKEISAFLSSLDQKIQTEKAILEQLEMQKKYLLQQMFV